MKKLIVFDLDGTLAPSKSSISADTATLISRLLAVSKVAVISGGDWPQFQKQILRQLLPQDNNMKNLFLLPTTGTKYYEYKSDWEIRYSEDFTEEEKKKIIEAIKQAVDKSGFEIKKVWGEQIEDRGSQITFSALGQQAPLEEKKKWDPDLEKRKKIKEFIEPYIPDYSVRLGGTTSIDITKPGIDKAYAVRKLRDILNIKIKEMIFIGDALYDGGNDFPVKETGIVAIQVKGPDETELIIKTIIACLEHD